MKTRAITGFFFVAVVLALLLAGSTTFALFFIIITIVCSLEFYKLVGNEDVKPQSFTGLLLLLSIIAPLINHFLNDSRLDYLLLSVPFAVLIIVAELYRKQSNPFHNIAYTVFGVIYSAIPFCFFYAMAYLDGDYNSHYPLAFLVMLWSSDTGAYLFGISLGKNRLFERHSPKKSWEGFAGGIICSMLAAFVISIYFKELLMFEWLLVAIIIAVAGTLGDLSESMLKRSLSTKDSGSFLPGHGGFLDRFDGLLLAAPLVYAYLYLTSIF